jgi:hypothetical protein
MELKAEIGRDPGERENRRIERAPPMQKGDDFEEFANI